jgi:hypothetical protein
MSGFMVEGATHPSWLGNEEQHLITQQGNELVWSKVEVLCGVDLAIV